MLSYETQLDLKRDIVVKAYNNYSNIPGSAMPSVLPSVPSPLQYGYHTKLTPHFDAPPSSLTHLVDAYCGAGHRSIPSFLKVAGFELSQDSIRFATRNARLNQIPSEKISFRSGNAGEIFAAVRDFPANETAILIDPPRKGCDEFFIQQLLDFGPKTVMYVSCNVHTQARGVRRFLEAGNAKSRKRYILESVRGFDLFPQTAHVESVAVLELL